MSNDQSKVIEVTESNFQTDVIEASKRVPVLLDFWAGWCGPCKMLGPVLERLAEEAASKFILGKINVDEQQTLAAQFDVRSIPHCILFKNGDIIGEFSGAQLEGNIRKFLTEHLEQSEAASKDSTALEAAKALLGEGDLESAEKSLQRIAENAPNNAEVAQLLSSIFFKREAASVSMQPGEMEQAYHAACVLAANSQHEDALSALLKLVETDKSWRDGAARRAILMIFDIIGQRSSLAEQFRRKLAMALYR